MPIPNARLGANKFPDIALVDRTREGKLDLAKIKGALQKQIEEDFFPVWGYSAELHIRNKALPDDWQIILLDSSEAAYELGYHDIALHGQPISKVFVQSLL